MVVRIGAIVPRTTVFDSSDPALELFGTRGVHTLQVGSRTFVYAAGSFDNGLGAFELGSDGSLTSIQNISDDATLKLLFAVNFTSAVVGGLTHLYVNAAGDDGISVFRVAADGTLTNLQNIADGVNLELDGSSGRMATATVGGTSFVIAAGTDDDGFSVFRILADGTLAWTDSIQDQTIATFELDGAFDVATAKISGRSFFFVAGLIDDGLSVFELNANGVRTNVTSVADDSVLELDGANGLATAVVGSATYLIASGFDDDGLSVFRVSGAGVPTNVFNLTDTAARSLDGANALTTFQLDGETFVVVSAQFEDALGVFHLGAGGRLSDVTTVFDSFAEALRGTFSNAFALAGGKPILLGTGNSDSGLTSYDIGSGNDTLVGSAAADLLLGLAGDDTLRGAGAVDRLLGGSGRDTLRGGRGNDELTGGIGTDRLAGNRGADDFVFLSLADSRPSRAGRDVILDFGDQDRIDLSAIDARVGHGNQAFQLDAGGGFVNGEIRQTLLGAGLLLEMNVDGDAQAEMAILLGGFNGRLTATDFVL